MTEAGLVLIGIGMGAIDGMTVEAVQRMKDADYRFLEAYTAKWLDEDIRRLEALVGPIELIMRPEVENPEKILALAKKSVVALLVIGDPLQATTHVGLQLQADAVAIPCHIVHGISITTLVTGAVGLSNYRFGRQTTLTYPYGEWVVTSPLEVIAINRALNMHTLVLFDLDPTGSGTGNQKPMQPSDAINSIRLMCDKLLLSIKEMESNDNLDVLCSDACKLLLREIESIKCVLCTDMGTSRQVINYGILDNLIAAKEGGLHCMVIPAIESDIEKSALSRWAKQ
jgi:diphthine synthase